MADEPLMIDDYQLINCIASGTDTQIWEATAGSRRVALKVLHPEAKADREKLGILKAEAKLGKSLEHPNLIRIHEFVSNKKNAYIVMDYFRAPNLKSQIHADLYEVQLRMKKLVESLCLALAYIHSKKWVHRDVKPDNILMNRGSEIRLIDFSLAHKIKRGKMKEIQGTKSYIAPETLMRRGPTPQTDMYSLGVTLYLGLTGELPITGLTPQDLLKNHMTYLPPKPSTIYPNVSPEMDAFVMKLLEKKPENRFKTMEEAYSVARAMEMFKENVEDVEAKRKAKETESLRDGVDAARRLDSRSDAERTKLLGKGADAKPWNAERKPKPAAKPQPVPAAKPAPPPQTQQQPAMTGYPQPPQPMQMPPGMPPQYYPGMPMPPYGAPMPGGYPGMPPQGMPMQGMPPQQPYPPMYPGAVPPPGMPPQQPPVQQQPAASPPPQPAPVAAKPQPAPAPQPSPNSDEDLPFMDELPDVL